MSEEASTRSVPDEWLGAPDQHVIEHGDPAFPAMLAELADPPTRLMLKGDPAVLQMPAIAIVGSRNPTESGQRTAYEFARHFARMGFMIVSGLATGIDAAAHRGAIEGGGLTVAFLGSGVDVIYPARNKELAAQVAENGALVSEYPLGSEPRRHYFPARNRLISGLSLGTLVVEAARRSGSLITARLAAEQGREVFAIPGSIHNPLARGCHRLIRDGAKLVESAEDIVAELGSLAGVAIERAASGSEPSSANTRDDSEYVKLLETLGHDPLDMDTLAQKSGLTIDQVSSMLLILELDGTVEKLPGSRFALLSPSSRTSGT